MKDGTEISFKSCMSLNISCKEFGYNVVINNISTDILSLLEDVKNRVRVVRKQYYVYTIYDKIKLGFLTKEGLLINYDFMITGLSKTKVVLTCMESEDAIPFVLGDEKTSDE